MRIYLTIAYFNSNPYLQVLKLAEYEGMLFVLEFRLSKVNHIGGRHCSEAQIHFFFSELFGHDLRNNTYIGRLSLLMCRL